MNTFISSGLAFLLLLVAADCAFGNKVIDYSIEPLSENTFVFIRSAAGDKKKSLYAYDLKIRKARLITDFEGSTIQADMDLSPDRRWVAFSALGFRLDATDEQSAVINHHLWKVSVDGKHFVRISKTGFPADSDCPDYVNSFGRHRQTCFRTRSEPRFSTDGEQIFCSMFFGQDIIGTLPCSSNADCPGASECYNGMNCRGIRFRGGSSLYRLSDKDVVGEALPMQSSCLFEGDPIISRAGDRMLFSLAQCSGSGTREGIHIMKSPFDRRTFQYVVSDNVEGDSIVWRPDGSGFLYRAGRNIKEYSFAYKSTAIRFQYRRGTIEGFSPNKDHSLMVIALKPRDKEMACLYLMHANTGKLEALTIGYNDTRPYWFP